MSQIDRRRIAALTEAQQERYRNRTGGSAEAFGRALSVMPKGVPSAFQANDPWPVFLTHGAGSRVWDVDGNEYRDFHNGSGVMVVGHANPRIGSAVKARIDEGTHFGAATVGPVNVATELSRRFGLPHWCYSNSGSEAITDAIHIARAATGRDLVLKVEGAYHGDHDSVMGSVYPSLEALEACEGLAVVPYGGGVPASVLELTRAVPYNDVERLEAALEAIGEQVACLIMEPVMTNINIVLPRDGYLQKARELTAKYGVKLIFDEIKTGATVAAGGVTERFSVEPDMVALAKAICGGYPGAALGIADDLAADILDGKVSYYGTFNGNPMVMAAAETTLGEVLTADAYEHLEQTNQRMLDGCQRVVDSYGLPAYTEGLGAKGCVVFAPERLDSYRDYLTNADAELSRLAWLFQMNAGNLATPGTEADWTLSIAHSEPEVERYVSAFEEFASEVTRA